MKVKAKFFVEVRFNAERTYRKHDWWQTLTSAIEHAQLLRAMEDANGTHVFPNIRIRYRGLTLERWKDGYLA